MGHQECGRVRGSSVVEWTQCECARSDPRCPLLLYLKLWVQGKSTFIVYQSDVCYTGIDNYCLSEKSKTRKTFYEIDKYKCYCNDFTLGSFRFEVNVMICFKKRWCIKKLFEENNLEIGFSVS